MEYKSVGGKDGARKAQRFGEYAKAQGWTGKWSEYFEGDVAVVHIYCLRGDNERLDLWWHDGSVIDVPVYTLAGTKITCRNVSAAAKVIAEQPSAERIKRSVRSRAKSVDLTLEEGDIVTPEIIDQLRGSLPFDGESDDGELEAVLHNRKITRVNRLSGQVNEFYINADRKFKVVRREVASEDYVEFIDATGWHAVNLRSIVSVA